MSLSIFKESISNKHDMTRVRLIKKMLNLRLDQVLKKFFFEFFKPIKIIYILMKFEIFTFYYTKIGLFT